MTENMKKFLEEASKDKEYLEKVNKAETPEAVIALAAEKGFTLTAEDLKPDQPSGKLNDDELDAVAGGKACACVMGGGGEEGTNDRVCFCVGAGSGNGYEWDANTNSLQFVVRCFCALAGGGTSCN